MKLYKGLAMLNIKSRSSLRRALSRMLILTLLLPPAASMYPRCFAVYAQSKVKARKPAGKATPDEAGKPDSALLPGKSVERAIARDERHSYNMMLRAGQYVRLLVEQSNVDLLLRFISPDGEAIIEDDIHSGRPKPISFIAQHSGMHVLEVRALGDQSPAGSYKLKIDELREATAADEDRYSAERAILEAERLEQLGTPESLRAAIEKYNGALSAWNKLGDSKQEAYTLFNLGGVYERRSQFDSALPVYERALKIGKGLNDRNIELYTLNNIGLIHSELGNNQKALEYLNASLPLARELGDVTLESTILANLGIVYWVSGETTRALVLFNDALILARQIKNRFSEATLLTTIGLFYSELDSSTKALEALGQALVIWRSLNNRAGEARVLSNIARTYSVLGNAQKATEYYLQAFAVYEALGTLTGQVDALTNIGAVYSDLGDKKRALEYYTRAFDLTRTVNDRRMQGRVLSLIAGVYLHLGENVKALDSYSEALQIFRDMNDIAEEASVLAGIGSIYFEMGDKRKALDYYEKALAHGKTLGNLSNQASLLYRIARVERDLGNQEKALSLSKDAIAMTESLYANATTGALRARYSASIQDYYGLYIDLLMLLHKKSPSNRYDIQAFEASEQARVRGLYDALTEIRTDIRQGVDPQLLERERALRQELNAKAQFQFRLLTNASSQQQVAAIRKEVGTLFTELETVEGQMREKGARFTAATPRQALSLTQIQQQALDPDSLLLEYSLGDERSYLWAVSSTALTSYELPGRGEIEAAARRVYELMSAPANSASLQNREDRDIVAVTPDRRYWQEAAALARMILGPAALRREKKRLLLVTEGALQYIPFAALPNITPDREKNAPEQPLILEYEITSLPSASTLVALRREREKRKPAGKRLMVLADPVLEKDDYRIKNIKINSEKNSGTGLALVTDSHRRSEGRLRSALKSDAVESALRFPRLPYSRSEAEQILSLAPPGQSRGALGFDASRAVAISPEVSQYSIIHFATHAFINNEHPELSGIILSLFDKQGSPQDGVLFAQDIYNLNLPAELVVLSGCRTALGKDLKGEGMVGISRSFMYAGAARIVASLWDVHDEATAELMARFYRGMLKEGLRPAAALRAAQIEMIVKSERWKSLYYWSAFTLQGEWR